MWKFHEEKEGNAFHKNQIHTNKYYFVQCSESKCPANVCGLRLARSQLMGEKKKVGKEERKKEERHWSIWMKRRQFLITSGGMWHRRTVRSQIEVFLSVFLFHIYYYQAWKISENNSWFVIFRAHCIHFVYFSAEWLAFRLFLHGCWHTTWA